MCAFHLTLNASIRFVFLLNDSWWGACAVPQGWACLSCSLMLAQCWGQCLAHSDGLMSPSPLSRSSPYPLVPAWAPLLSPQLSPQCTLPHCSLRAALSLFSPPRLLLPLHCLTKSSPSNYTWDPCSPVMVSTTPLSLGFPSLTVLPSGSITGSCLILSVFHEKWCLCSRRVGLHEQPETCVAHVVP